MGGAFMFVMGFLASGFPLLNQAMVADANDAIRLEHGQDSTGLLYAMVCKDQKVVRALSIGLSFTLLGWLCYQATEGVTNTPGAIRAMGIVFLAAQVLFVLLEPACFLDYGLTAARHAEIRAARLAERIRTGGKSRVGGQRRQARPVSQSRPASRQSPPLAIDKRSDIPLLLAHVARGGSKAAGPED